MGESHQPSSDHVQQWDPIIYPTPDVLLLQSIFLVLRMDYRKVNSRHVESAALVLSLNWSGTLDNYEVRAGVLPKVKMWPIWICAGTIFLRSGFWPNINNSFSRIEKARKSTGISIFLTFSSIQQRLGDEELFSACFLSSTNSYFLSPFRIIVCLVPGDEPTLSRHCSRIRMEISTPSRDFPWYYYKSYTAGKSRSWMHSWIGSILD